MSADPYFAQPPPRLTPATPAILDSCGRELLGVTNGSNPQPRQRAAEVLTGWGVTQPTPEEIDEVIRKAIKWLEGAL